MTEEFQEFDLYDATDDDAYCEGDPTIDEVDPEELKRLAAAFDEVALHEEGLDRNFAMLGVLHEMHGDNLEIL